jgi:type IV pilus assembly protein PilY1
VTDAGLRAGGDPLPPAGSANRYFLVKVAASAPQGVIQEFNGRIRFGAMSFNPLGNVSECNQSGANMKCPSNLKVCSVSTTMQCTVNTDCPAGETCVAAQNLDGAKVIHYIRNVCSVTTGTECKVNADCPANETCVSPVGDHTSGLVKAINDVRAGTWTPYAEAFYNAIGYFARTNDYTVSPGLSRNLRINATDFVLNKNPSQYPCQRNNILVISDGMSTADLNANVNTLVSQYNDGDGQYDTGIGACPKFAGSRNLDDIAWLAWNKNITDFSDAMTTEEKKDPRNHSKYIKTYVVYTGSADTDPGECSAETLMRQTGTNGCGTGTECYQRAENYDQLVAALKRVLQDLAAPASGTASSVLASSQGSGANLLQAIFFPMDKRFDREVAWTGEMQNLWYFLDPELEAETIREDSNENKEFELSSDRVIRFFFDNSVARTRVERAGTTVEIEDIKDIWKVGEKLWGTDPASRTIYTWAGGAPSLMSFSTGSASTLRPYLQAADDTEAGETIRYVRGEDLPNFCSVTTTKQCVSNNDCPSETCIIKNRMRAVKIGGIEKTWKLGDIVSSTPKQQTSIPLNSYHLSPPSGYADTTYEEFINDDAYKARGMVYVGANDGMLHAFRFGVLEQINDPDQPEKKAKLTGTDLGKEEWAYVPRNALPYLKYLRDPSYCHLNFVDAAPYIFDASIGGAAGGTKEKGSWRTILIGGMGLGGACRKDGVCSKTTTQSCNTDAQCPVNEQCLCVGNCVTTPRLDPDNASQGLGYSSYFAFDVTDPTNPVLLWEFSDPRLGFSTSGPAIVRIGGKDENGQWYAVFGSGPTGPIDLAHYQFLGNSDQRMRLFVLDLRTGSLVGQPLDTGIDDGFAGSLINATVDTDRWSGTSGGFYKDDALYFGYTKKANDGTWTDGGILRVLTKESSPGSWEVGHVLRDTGPVTAAISKLQDRKKGREALWRYFGGGRYFYKSDVTTDDPTNRRRLYGVKEPCYTAATNDIDQSCNAEAGGLVNQTTSPTETLNASAGGWHIELDGESADGIYKAERILTDPLAAFNGAVFFVSVMPSADVCGFGGQTYLWAVRYNTGGRAPSDSLQGSALVQVSTGSIEQIKLATAITDDAAHKEGRRTAPGTFGVPPRGPGLTVVVNPRPVKRVLHIQEK